MCVCVCVGGERLSDVTRWSLVPSVTAARRSTSARPGPAHDTHHREGDGRREGKRSPRRPWRLGERISEERRGYATPEKERSTGERGGAGGAECAKESVSRTRLQLQGYNYMATNTWLAYKATIICLQLHGYN